MKESLSLAKPFMKMNLDPRPMKTLFERRALHQLIHRCRGLQLRRPLFFVAISVRAQTLYLFKKTREWKEPYTRVAKYRISSSRYGTGQIKDSNRTPLGLHRVDEKIGAGRVLGTVFQARQPIGFTWAGLPSAPIVHRILWLEGLEKGINRGGHVDSRARYIYIHGTSDEMTLGRPASRGCIHLASKDLLALFRAVPIGTLIWIDRD